MTTEKQGSPPAGYLQNAQGHLVPENSIKDLDRLRHDMVQDIIGSARGMQEEMGLFKANVLNDIHAFVSLAAEQYDTVLGGKKGNLMLSTFDGKYKVSISVSDTLAFDERLLIAKQLINDCIHEWTKSSGDNIRALIEHAFQTDKAGNINTARVLGLLKLKIDDANWKKAMEALKDSISVASSKSYMRLHERVGDEGKYQQISLDMSAL